MSLVQIGKRGVFSLIGYVLLVLLVEDVFACFLSAVLSFIEAPSRGVGELLRGPYIDELQMLSNQIVFQGATIEVLALVFLTRRGTRFSLLKLSTLNVVCYFAWAGVILITIPRIGELIFAHRDLSSQLPLLNLIGAAVAPLLVGACRLIPRALTVGNGEADRVRGG